MRRTLATLAVALTLTAGSAAADPVTVTAVPPTPQVGATIATNLAAPWGIAFLPDGSALVSERNTAQLKRIANGTTTTVGTVPGVVPGGEGGLLGIAVAPTFATDRLVYAYFTAANDNRVVRMTFNGTSLGTPEVIISGIAKSTIHNGGRLAFGPDGMLFVTTGDAGNSANAQNPNSLNGKILRVTPTGAAAPGNPTAGSRVYSMGHRNVQGLAFEGGRIWASEFGQNTWDELNLIQAGRNYGWPTVEGRAGNPNFVDPIAQWSPAEASPSGIAFAANTVWLASLRGQRLWGVPVLNGGPDGNPVAFLNGTLGRLRLITNAPDGSLWLMTNNTDGRGTPRAGDDRIVRVTLGTQPPPPPPPPPPPGGCTVRDDLNAWNTGFTSNFTITNNSATAINGWSLVFTLPAGQVITSGWNATYTPTSGQVTARNVSFNAVINPNGGTVSGFGFQATHTGNTAKPTSFTLNGTACTVA